MNTNKLSNAASLLLIIAILFISGNLFAQKGQRQGPPKMPSDTEINEMVSELSEELSLSKDQETKIQELYTKHFAEVKTAMSGERKSREEMEAYRTKFEDQVKSVLNDDQQELFDELKKSNNKKSGEQRERH